MAASTREYGTQVRMREYWENHAAHWADLDYTRDPDGLGNVCHADEPLWLNTYYARFQRRVFHDLLARVPAPTPTARAIDVGCGAGRWARLLAARGYETTGIDLQPQLIDLNRRRDPHITYLCTSIAEYTADAPADLLTSVTVIQHIPFKAQDGTIHKLRELVTTGGHALVLENVAEHAAHVFSNTIGGWQARFERAGFRCLTVRRYDYSPTLRCYLRLARALRRSLRPDAIPIRRLPIGNRAERHPLLNAAHTTAKRVAVTIDSLVEPLSVRSNLPLPTVHCGFLFRAV